MLNTPRITNFRCCKLAPKSYLIVCMGSFYENYSMRIILLWK